MTAIEQWVRAAKGEGDDIALRNEFERRLMSLVRKHLPTTDLVRAHMDSQDLRSTVQCALLKDVDGFRGTTEASFWAFVESVVVNTKMVVLRGAVADKRSVTRTQPLTRSDDPPTEARGPATETMERDDVVRLKSIVARLPDTHREVLELFAEGVSGPAMAERLGVTPVAARQRLARALFALREASGAS